MTSRTIASYGAARAIHRASSPLAARSAGCPSSPSPRTSRRPSFGSSSTIRILISEILTRIHEPCMRAFTHLSSPAAALVSMLGSELRRAPATARAEAHVGRRVLGGAVGNNRLTSVLGVILLIGLAVEGVTIPRIHQLLSVHVFVGMLLLGPVAAKLASTGYRFARYYAGGVEYVRLGPPQPLMRFLVAPVLVLSTLTLFGS